MWNTTTQKPAETNTNLLGWAVNTTPSTTGVEVEVENNHYWTYAEYHLSGEGSIFKRDPNKYLSDYVWDQDTNTHFKCFDKKVKARKDYPERGISKGEVYILTKIRFVDDLTGATSYGVWRQKLKKIK
jgi:hypothetical protein